MKTINLLLLTGFGILVFSGCQEKITDKYMVNVPVYMERAEFKNAVKVTSAEEISQPGKIYLKDNYIFINENMKGIHVIDNSDPANPEIIAFVEIPGNVDMAVKDSILYADSFTDLVALDISDINNIHEVNRIDSIFPYIIPQPAVDNQLPFGQVEPDKGIVVGWETMEVQEEVASNVNLFPTFNRFEFLASASNSKVSYYTNGSPAMSVGIGGSMARFTILNNFLYTVDRSNLRAFDIDNLVSPLLVADISIGWNIETIFPYQNKLFFGTQTGMIIYDISNPVVPVYKSTYSHVKSCDPVVVNGQFAYVTLRAGNLCGEATSQLDVIDISNVLNPQWEQSYPMQEPYGLGIDNQTLFVCDGVAGLKVYNAEDPQNLIKLAWFDNVNAFDVIPFNGILLMIGKEGLYQYDYSGSSDISLLSHIAITPHNTK